jgi:hypothetical protein
MPVGGVLLGRSAWNSKRLRRENQTSVRSLMTRFLFMGSMVLVQPPGSIRPIELMPFASTKAEYNEDGK